MKYLLYMREKDSSEYISMNDINSEPLISSGGGHRINRILFALMSGVDKSKLVHVDDEKGYVHTSYLLGKSFKFSFLNHDDYEIGPCFTREDSRGKGIYPDVLRYICSNFGSADTKFYMLVAQNNKSSIRGIEKAGFRLVGEVMRSRYIRRWEIVQ